MPDSHSWWVPMGTPPAKYPGGVIHDGDRGPVDPVQVLARVRELERRLAGDDVVDAEAIVEDEHVSRRDGAFLVSNKALPTPPFLGPGE